MKLIDLLVKELPQRGGWPDGATECYWHKGFDVAHFYDATGNDVAEPIYVDGVEWCGSDGYGVKVTRYQYEAALAASDDWIEWHGGECPVDSEEIVEVKYRSPNPYQHNNDRAGDFSWAHTGGRCDIIAYRVHATGIKSRASNDRLEQDLNECIDQDIDVVNHPSHYTKGNIECIDAIESATTGKSGIEAVCVANIIKYLYRYEEKNGLEDVKKAKWYLNKLISELESN